jgi:hypothetical protein
MRFERKEGKKKKVDESEMKFNALPKYSIL